MCCLSYLLANQEFIVHVINFCRKLSSPFEKLISNSSVPSVTESDIIDNPDLDAMPTTPVISELSVEFEKLCVKLLRRSNPILSSSSVSTCPFILSASIDFEGLGIEATVGNEILIEGHLEGAMVRDLTEDGQTYSLIVSVGKCRDGRNIDMITTMVTSLNSLLKPSEVISFQLKRVPRGSAHDVFVSAHIPSILYTHSVNLVRELEMFFVEFKQYVTTLSSSVKSAAIEVAKGLVSDESHLALGLNRLSSTLGGATLQRDTSIEDEANDGDKVSSVDRVLIDILVMSPVIVIPSSRTSSDTIVAHLGEISVKSSYMSLSHGRESSVIRDCALSSSEIDRLAVKISNMSLNASHDAASLDWLKQDSTEGFCTGQWSQILKETSFELVIERAVGGVMHSVDPDVDDTVTVDVTISCSLSNSLFVSLSKKVFDQLKCTAQRGIYIPLSKPMKPNTSTPSSVPKRSQTDNKANNSMDTLPRIIACFALPQLSIEFTHTVGDEEKKIAFVSLEDFLIRCRKTNLHHTYIDVGLKTVIIEDLLQKKDAFRYILSSTQNPLPFSSPMSTPSVFSHSIGISPNPFLSLSHLISSPKPQSSVTSPLRSFNPHSTASNINKTKKSNTSEAATPTSNNNTGMTTPPNESHTSSITDIQDLVSISVHHVSPSSPEFATTYKSIALHVDVAFSTVYLIINLQTWVLFFDYLGIGIPTPPSSPVDDDHKPFFQADDSTDDDTEYSNMLSLQPNASITINQVDSTPPAGDSKVPDSKSTVWGVEGKTSANLSLKVQSLTVTLNKPEHPLARGIAGMLEVNATLEHSNMSVKGSLGQASLIDLTDTGAYYRERFTTTGDEALSFDVFK